MYKLTCAVGKSLLKIINVYQNFKTLTIIERHLFFILCIFCTFNSKGELCIEIFYEQKFSRNKQEVDEFPYMLIYL